MNKLFNWYLSKTLKWRKIKLLHEINDDIAFIETHKTFSSVASEDKMRQELSDENKLPKPDAKKIDRLSRLIAEANSTRAELERLRQVALELPKYIKML
jgi:hypothetical protein